MWKNAGALTRSAEPKSVTITAHSDPKAFAALVRPWLLQDEAVHCLPLGIVDALAANVSEAFVPRYWRPIMFVVRNLPEPVFQRIKALSGR